MLGAGEAGAGGEGSPLGPLPRRRRWPPTNPKRCLPSSGEEGQVEKQETAHGMGGEVIDQTSSKVTMAKRSRAVVLGLPDPLSPAPHALLTPKKKVSPKH